MALVTSPPHNPKPLRFSPLRHRLHASLAAPGVLSHRHNQNLSKHLLFGSKNASQGQNPNTHLLFGSKNASQGRNPNTHLLFASKNASHSQNPNTHLLFFSKNASNQKRGGALVTAAMSDAAAGRRIPLSDVVVKTPTRVVFSDRKWSAMDAAAGATVLSLHLLALLAPFHFNWGAFWVFVALYVVTGLFGITLSYHRNLTHRSFKLPKVLEYLFAYCGALALQGSPIEWVSVHRYHHQFCDSEKDPHSPLEGFWFSHMSWMFDTKSLLDKCGGTSNAGDLEKQSFYRFIHNTYILHPIALGCLLYALGGLPFVVWGMGVRIVWVYHITWLVNSACHVWGKQAWNTGDLSKNNWWVAVLAFGEGWHNNHHAFEYSARHGLEWWQLDMTWYVVRLLQALGLASDVKLPSDAQKGKMAFNDGTIAIDG